MLLSSFPPRNNADEVIAHIKGRLANKNDLIVPDDWTVYGAELTNYCIDEEDALTELEQAYNAKIVEYYKELENLTAGEKMAKTTPEYKSFKHQEAKVEAIKRHIRMAEGERFKRRL